MTTQQLTLLTSSDDDPEDRVAGPSMRDATGRFWDVWCVFEGDDFELCDQFELPEWLEFEIEMVGLTYALSESKWDATGRALELGVAPGQPFLVRFRQPTYWRDYWGEWDSEAVQGEVVGVSPRTVEQIVRAWSDWIAEGYRVIASPGAG